MQCTCTVHCQPLRTVLRLNAESALNAAWDGMRYEESMRVHRIVAANFDPVSAIRTWRYARQLQNASMHLDLACGVMPKSSTQRSRYFVDKQVPAQRVPDYIEPGLDGACTADSVVLRH